LIFFAFNGPVEMDKFCVIDVAGGMKCTHAWEAAYLAAVCETNDSMMMGRILEARAAIEQRLLAPIEKDSLEYGELTSAQKALELLKAEGVDSGESSSVSV
jgi:hypothetical protein